MGNHVFFEHPENVNRVELNHHSHLANPSESWIAKVVNPSTSVRLLVWVFNRGAEFCKCDSLIIRIISVKSNTYVIELLTEYIMSEFCCGKGGLGSALHSQLFTLLYCLLTVTSFCQLYYSPSWFYTGYQSPKYTNKGLCCRNLITC